MADAPLSSDHRVRMQDGPELDHPTARGMYAIYCSLHGQHRARDESDSDGFLGFMDRGGFTWAEIGHLWAEHVKQHGSPATRSMFAKVRDHYEKPAKPWYIECNKCHRQDNPGYGCNALQPDGTRCNGTMRRTMLLWESNFGTPPDPRLQP